MSLPYEKSNIPVTVVSAGDIHAFDAPSRVELEKVLVFFVTTGAFTVDVWNRAFTTPAIDIVAIENDGNGKARILVETPIEVNVGDPVTVAANSVVGYNTVHRVVSVSYDGGGQRIVTDQNYSALGTGGTAQLTITGSEKELYRVLAQQTGAGNLTSFNTDHGQLFVNQDPKLHDGSTHQRKIYLEFSAGGDYRVSLAFRSHESFQM